MMRKTVIGLVSLALAAMFLAGCGGKKQYHTGYTGPVMDEDEYEREHGGQEETNPDAAVTVPEEVVPTYTLMMVNADTLNVRSGPGKANESVGELHWGDLVALYETDGKWGRIEAGWVSLDYIEEHNPIISEDNDERPDAMPYKLMKITAKSMNIRNGAAKKYDTIGEYHKGDLVAVYESTENWGRTDLGWINLEYAEDHNPGVQMNPPIDIERPDDYIDPKIVGTWYQFYDEGDGEYGIDVVIYNAEGDNIEEVYTYCVGDDDSTLMEVLESPDSYTFDGVCVVAHTTYDEEFDSGEDITSYRVFVIDDILTHENVEKDETAYRSYYLRGDLEDAMAAVDRYHAKKYPPETPAEPETETAEGADGTM